MIRSDEEKVLWIQRKAFDLLEEITDEPLFYMNIHDEAKKYVRAATYLHAIIIQALQTGNYKRASQYLLILWKVNRELTTAKDEIKCIIEDKFKQFHGILEQ